jgi:hypothetical protein
VRSAADASPGDTIHVRVSDALLDVSVTAVAPLAIP